MVDTVDSLLWGSTIGYPSQFNGPSDSLASCFLSEY